MEGTTNDDKTVKTSLPPFCILKLNMERYLKRYSPLSKGVRVCLVLLKNNSNDQSLTALCIESMSPSDSGLTFELSAER